MIDEEKIREDECIKIIRNYGLFRTTPFIAYIIVPKNLVKDGDEIYNSMEDMYIKLDGQNIVPALKTILSRWCLKNQNRLDINAY